MLKVISDRLPEFVEDYAARQLILTSLMDFGFSPYTGEPGGQDYYGRRYEEPYFLSSLGGAYRVALEHWVRIGELWHRAGLGSVDALGRFLKAGIEATRMDCKVGMYFGHILAMNPGLFKCNWKDSARPDLEQAPLTTAKDVEEFRTMVCNDYEELSNELVGDLFGGVAEEPKGVLGALGDVLRALEGPHRAEAYNLFKDYLDDSLCQLTACSPANVKRAAAEFEPDLPGGPSNVQALVRLRASWKILNFKLEFLELEHDGDRFNKLFQPNLAFEEALDKRPPLLARDMILSEFGRAWESQKDHASKETQDIFDRLERWAYSLYLEVQSGGERSGHNLEVAEWMSKVEGNLRLILETIGTHGEQQRRRMLAAIFCHLDPIVLNVERIQSELLFNREERPELREPWHFLIELRQMVEGACPFSKCHGVKSSRKTKEQDDRQSLERDFTWPGNSDFEQESACSADNI